MNFQKVIFIYLLLIVSILADTETRFDKEFIEDHERFMSALKEPRIMLKSDLAKVYRFTLPKTFSSPIVVRVEIGLDGRGILYTKKTDGVSGYGIDEIGKLVKNDKRELTEAEAFGINGVIKENDFWMTKDLFEPSFPMDLIGSWKV